MAKLTKQQALAVNHLHGNILVAAGAGSGKTKVLTERVLKLLLVDRIPLSQLLLLTFTHAAANEMKARVRQALLDQEAYQLASEVDQAFIMTFDAFALYLVETYGVYGGIAPGIGVFDKSLYDVSKRTTLETIIQEAYDHHHPEWLGLVREYVVNRDDALKHLMLQIDDHADLLLDKIKYFQTYLDIHFEQSWLGEKQQELFQYYRHELALLQKEAIAFESVEQTRWFTELLHRLQALPTLDDLLNEMTLLEYPRLKPNELSEEDKALRDRMKKRLQDFKNDATMVPLAGQIDRYNRTRTHVQGILAILMELNARLDKQKQTYHRYPFTDIAKMAFNLLHVKDVFEAVQSRFQFVMVDEYQDTNDLQEAVLMKLAKQNLMMVGDVKQSIYRFRNANSALIHHKLTTYQDYELSQNPHETKLMLQDNYRSRPEVIDEINRMFTFLMSETYGGVDYDHHQSLKASHPLYPQLKDASSQYGFKVYRYHKTEFQPERNEPRIIAEDILHQLAQGVQVVDLDQGKLRPARFQDFTILIDRKGNFESFIDVFHEYGIPLEVLAERDLSQSDFFRVMKNMMTLMVHLDMQQPQPQKEYLHAYVSVLRSFLFQTSDQALYQFALGKKPLEDFPLHAILVSFSTRHRHEPLYTWMEALMEALTMEQRLLSLPDVPANFARLEAWMNTVQTYSELGLSLLEFETFLKESQTFEVELSMATPKQTDNAVRLMTIHKSKGLEFSIVYYAGLTKGFNTVEMKGVYQHSLKYGVQLPYPEAIYHRPIFADLILREERQAMLSEQIRLWYVALTRAKEQVILVVESSQKKTIVDIEKARSLEDFLYLYQASIGHDPALDTWIDLTRPPYKLDQHQAENKIEAVQFDAVNIPETYRTTPRASRVNEDENNEALLAYGTYLHECLFLLDFATFDTSFIQNEQDRARIDALIHQPFFQMLKKQVAANTVILQKEYAYLDSVSQQKGIIDLLIIEGNQVTIIDYKTSDIEDTSYIHQLMTYQHYLESQGLKVNAKYLISLVQGRMKRID